MQYSIGTTAQLQLTRQKCPCSGDDPSPAFELINPAPAVVLGSGDMCVAEPKQGETATLRVTNDYPNPSRLVLEFSFSGAIKLDIQPEISGTNSSWVLSTKMKGDRGWTKHFTFTQDSSSTNTASVDLANPSGDNATGNKLEVTNDSDDASEHRLRLVLSSLDPGEVLDVDFTYIEAELNEYDEALVSVIFSAKDNEDENLSDPIFRIKSKPPKTIPPS